MADLNQLAQEKDALTKEANEIVKEADAQIKAITKETEEKLKPANERLSQIQKEILDEVDAQAGIVKE
jgi:gas vesicle protein